MGQSLDQLEESEDSKKKKAPKIAVSDIQYSGEKLIIPASMTAKQAIELLQRRMKYDQEVVQEMRTFDAFPWDGAVALDAVLTKMFGWTPAEAQRGFFGPIPPKTISVEVGYGQVQQVPWGEFSLPHTDGGKLMSSVNQKNGRTVFQLSALVKRQDQDAIYRIFDAIEEHLHNHSIYRGKAIKIRFRDDDGDKLGMPEPSFLDTSKIDINGLIYSDSVMDAVRTSLFTPIIRTNDLIANGVPVKRGVLLGGTYGTGKTMAATVASRLAEDHHITYVYCPRASELADAIEFAKQYQSPACVVFCEDIDRAVNGERTVAMDDVLNIIDGIDSKKSNIITVLTTNDLDGINPAMLRPGRLDAVIEVTPPDAGAIEKLIRYYGGESIRADEDLSEASKVLADQQAIPAIVAEVVNRAKLAQITLQEPGTKVRNITGEALTVSSETMAMQLNLLARAAAQNDEVWSIEKIVERVVSSVRDDVPYSAPPVKVTQGVRPSAAS